MEQRKMKFISNLKSGKTVENPQGIFRTTMSFNEKTMMCHFIVKKGASVPLHSHKAVQNGYVINGKVKFLKKDGSSFIVEEGSGYIFESNETHGAEILQDAEFVECFSPMRQEYADF